MPHVVEGRTAALLQGAPVPVGTLDIVVADDDDVLERLTRWTVRGPLGVRLGDPPECVTLIIQDKPVAVVPLVAVEAGDCDVRRVLERTRSRWPTSAG